MGFDRLGSATSVVVATGGRVATGTAVGAGVDTGAGVGAGVGTGASVAASVGAAVGVGVDGAVVGSAAAGVETGAALAASASGVAGWDEAQPATIAAAATATSDRDASLALITWGILLGEPYLVPQVLDPGPAETATRRSRSTVSGLPQPCTPGGCQRSVETSRSAESTNTTDARTAGTTIRIVIGSSREPPNRSR